jgi:hypothetical protein
MLDQNSSMIITVAVDEDFSSPPAQIPACAANAPGLYEDAAVKGVFQWC